MLNQGASAAGIEVALDLSHDYDALDNLHRLTDHTTGTPEAQTFGYDALDSLASAHASAPSQS